MGEIKRKKKHVGGKKEKKKIRAFATPRLELSPITLSQLSNRVCARDVIEFSNLKLKSP